MSFENKTSNISVIIVYVAYKRWHETNERHKWQFKYKITKQKNWKKY